MQPSDIIDPTSFWTLLVLGLAISHGG